MMSFSSSIPHPDTETPKSTPFIGYCVSEFVPEMELQPDLSLSVAYVSDSPSDEESDRRGQIPSKNRLKHTAARRRRLEDRVVRDLEADRKIFMHEHRRERERIREILKQSESLKEIHRIFLPRLFEDPPNAASRSLILLAEIGLCDFSRRW